MLELGTNQNLDHLQQFRSSHLLFRSIRHSEKMPLIIQNSGSVLNLADSSSIPEASLRELDVSTISSEISRIQNSISHLERSNQELNQFANSTDPEDGLEESDKRELKSSIQENQGVM